MTRTEVLPSLLLLLLLLHVTASTSADPSGLHEVNEGAGECACVAWEEAFLYSSVCGRPVRRLTPGQRYHRDGLPTASSLVACGSRWTRLRLGGGVFWTTLTKRTCGHLDSDSCDDGMGVCACRPERELPAAVTGPSNQLINCLCVAESNCNSNIGCRWGKSPVGSVKCEYCGPFMISLAYFQLAGGGGVGDWTACTTGPNNIYCSSMTVRSFVSRYTGACVGTGPPTDEDYARVHIGGPTGCRDPNTLPFWKRVLACMGGSGVDIK